MESIPVLKADFGKKSQKWLNSKSGEQVGNGQKRDTIQD